MFWVIFLAAFTGEEANGKYVDMHHLYLEFTNLKKIKESGEYKIGDYLWYLQHFDQYEKEFLVKFFRFHEIPYHLKDKEYKKYKRYLKNVVEYLKDFFKRTQPLTDFNVIDIQTSKLSVHFSNSIRGGFRIPLERRNCQRMGKKRPQRCQIQSSLLQSLPKIILKRTYLRCKFLVYYFLNPLIESFQWQEAPKKCQIS